MKLNNNISTKKLFRFIIGAVLVGVFFVAFGAAINHQNAKKINNIKVNIVNENEHNFIQKQNVIALIKTDKHINLASHTIGNIDLSTIENTIKKNPWIVNAQIYVDNTHTLNVDITQRIPVARLFFTNGSSAYMDSTLQTLPLSTDDAFAAPVFTNIPFLGKDTFSHQLKTKIEYLSSKILADTFWNAQIAQIVYQPAIGFEMIPVVGSQKIIFGDTTRIEDKLANLMVFYKNVSNRIGWNKYETLDVRYKNQVLASPAIGYVPPKIQDTTHLDITLPPKEAPTPTVVQTSTVTQTTNTTPHVSTKVNDKPVISTHTTKENKPPKTSIKTNSNSKTTSPKPKFILPKQSTNNNHKQPSK